MWILGLKELKKANLSASFPRIFHSLLKGEDWTLYPPKCSLIVRLLHYPPQKGRRETLDTPYPKSSVVLRVYHYPTQ